MKNLQFRATMIFFIMGLFAFNFYGKVPDDDFILPLDSAVRYGKLPNGLTYYIMHNQEPRNRADFYIAQKVGSILEEDNQQGLAHFFEHMAFNGTKHFPGKSLIEYLQNNGIKFGNDINAYTSFDQTVYNICNVPTTNQALMDSVALALFDWGNNISLDNSEIDKERGVIQEEWRTRGDANMRMYEKILPIMYPGSRYASRMPIGSMDVVMNFKPQTLRDYYETWYRPDQQGIIIIGDFDAVKMEQNIRKLFTQSQMPENPKTREYFPVPDNKDLIYALFTDPEATNSTVQLYFKHDRLPQALQGSMFGYKQDILNILTQIMFAERFNDKAQKPNSPYMYAYGYDDDFFVAKTKDAYTFYAVVKDNRSLDAFKDMMGEARRVQQYGFTESELDRAKQQLIISTQNQYLERNKEQNSYWANQCIQHFIDGEPFPGVEFDYNLIQEYLPKVTLKDVNAYYAPKIKNENVEVVISGNDRKDLIYPTETKIRDTFESILKEKSTPFEDTSIALPLLTSKPKEGSILKESVDSIKGITTLKLSNGATVLLKSTDFKNDEISMGAISFGGKWIYGSKNVTDLKIINTILDISALGNYTRTNLAKYMADKNASITFDLDDPTENIYGVCSKKDFETLLQLNYEIFTDLRKDTLAFKALQEKLTTAIEGRNKNPRAIMSDSISNTIYSHNPLYQTISTKDVSEINYDNVLNIARQRLANAGDYTFVFVGNFNVDSIKPLIKKYIASLPDKKVREKVKYKVGTTHGIINNIFDLPMANPKTSIFEVFSGPMKYSMENEVMLDMLENIMEIAFTNTIREEEGGTYGVNTSASLDQYNHEWTFSYFFDTSADKQEKLYKRANDVFFSVLKKGADENIFKKVKEATINQYENNLRNNSYWISVLRNQGIGIDIYTNYGDFIKNITLEQLNLFMKNIDCNKNRITVIMKGIPNK